MNISQMPPVIVGSGLSGTTISLMLSRARIPHVLIGQAPNALPRLGESLNLEGTVSLLELFPEFSQYYLTKKLVIGYLGRYVLSCDFEIARKPQTRTFFKLLGYTAPQGFLHLDRIGLDAALYKNAIASPYCTAREAQVVELAYDAASDTIQEINLSTGDTLRASYVFDATNQGRLISKAAGVPCHPIGDPQRVVYTHYRLSTELSTEAGAEASSDQSRRDGDRQKKWEHATGVLRLFKEEDSIEAIAWCIPLKTYVSIGISRKANDNDLTDEAILQIVERAYARRGLHYRDRFPEATTTMALNHQYFVHERAYGANWMLAGPAFCQVWWMSGSGVGTSLAAARLAPRVLRDPLRVGHAYETYMRELVAIHDTFDWFLSTDAELFTPEGIRRQSDGFVRTNIKRLVKATYIRGNRVGRVCGYLHDRLSTETLVKCYCKVYRAKLQEQTRRIFGNDD